MNARFASPDYMVLTGFSCSACGAPLHPAIVTDGFSTHPACDRPSDRVRGSARASLAAHSHSDPGYCSSCGMPTSKHLGSCKAAAA